MNQRNGRGPRLFLIGAQPPPVHGMSAVNAAIRDRLQTQCELAIINLSAPDLERTIRTRARRFVTVVEGARQFLSTARRSDKLYMSISGGLGQIYEIAFLLAARRLHMRCYLHHHSYSYLDAPTALTNLLMRAAGDSATHVALSRRMADRLVELYGVRHVIPISNAALLMGDFSPAALRSTLRTIGFISNISAEKGVFDFLELMSAIESNGLPIAGLLAGPFTDRETEKAVRARLSTLRAVTYLGPRYGVDKDEFFRSIDGLIFPTRYVNEAEPLTIHEALMHGVPVIAYGRGSIPELLSPEAGLTIPVGDSFTAPAVAQLKAWLEAPDRFKAASRLAGARFHHLRSDSTARWAELEVDLAKS